MTIPPEVEQVQRLRRLGTARLELWGLRALADEVGLLISEMVTNAIEHGDGENITVSLAWQGDVVRLDVRDGSPRRPLVRHPGPEEESGRGMLLIAALSDSWGTSADGTSTWCTVRVATPAPASATACHPAFGDEPPQPGHQALGQIADAGESRGSTSPRLLAQPSPATPCQSSSHHPTRKASMTTSSTPDQESADAAVQLREALIDRLRSLNAIRTDAVCAAIRAVPRHLFIPEAQLSQAYAAEEAFITKEDADGVALSSVSAARIQAFMLEQAEVRPGMRVLEIGSGGLNAAYLAELVGGQGEVTSIDIDPDVVARARRLLDGAGYERVRVCLADGEEGEPRHAPYDRILVTVGAWDIPLAWTDQLADGGRLVVPLRARGLTRSVAFEPVGGHLVSRSYELCGFVPMQGAGENRVRLVLLHDEAGEEVGLRLDDGRQVDAQRLRQALQGPRVEAWSGVTIGGCEPWDQLDLWLATALPDFVLLTAKRAARDRGIVATASPMGTPAIADGGTLAYRALRPLDPERTRFEFGAIGHGPAAKEAVDRLVEQIRIWDREHRDGQARFEVYPAGAPDDELPAGRVVDKRHTRVTISWPSQQH